MPELPEVETTRRGIAPYLAGRRITGVDVREPRLRWPVSPALARELPGRRVLAVRRRGKYLLLDVEGETCLILHLGMSGSLRMVSDNRPAERHDHLDLRVEGALRLRLHDPRRFGAAIWIHGDPLAHPLLSGLGPEPLEPGFDGTSLHALSRGRRVAVKCFVMNGRVVTGVGNIYASEALHLAGIHPARPAGRIAAGRYRALAGTIRRVLGEAIEAGGTTLRDFVDEGGHPGLFAPRLRVYGRTGAPCPGCGEPVRMRVIGQRASYFCPRCQR
jgi:formamidopyrimidine-DNA glycosylase